MVPWLEVALERGKRHRVISKVYVRHGINEICRYQLNKSGDLRHDASEWRLVYLALGSLPSTLAGNQNVKNMLDGQG